MIYQCWSSTTQLKGKSYRSFDKWKPNNAVDSEREKERYYVDASFKCDSSDDEAHKMERRNQTSPLENINVLLNRYLFHFKWRFLLSKPEARLFFFLIERKRRYVL